MTVSVQSALAEEQWVSDRLSSQVRMITVGMLAFAWALLTSPPSGLNFHREGLIAVGLLSLLALVTDWFQYLCGYVYTTRHRRELERTGQDLGYDVHAKGRRLRVRFFWVKQGITLLAFVILILVIVPSIL